MTAPSDVDTRMLTALVQLRGALQAARLPLDVPGVEQHREARLRMVDQLEAYVIPRQMSVDAPLLVVVGGSTGAGKSTLVNSLVGGQVTASGLLRPTTRSPVLIHHPDDGHWFGPERLLPELVRVDHATDDAHSVQLVPDEKVPAGLAILDAPDVDSVEEDNRLLAAHLLAAADLWLFVTSAARYSDQVPWDYLKDAAERGASVAIVLDRTPADAVQTVAAHLARMLASRGLKDSPLFTVNESAVSDEGLLDPAEVADIRGWLDALAGDGAARSLVVRQTLDGTIRALAGRTYAIADAVQQQVRAVDDLRSAAGSAYDDACELLVAQSGDGSLLRGEVLARWQELVGSGELLRSLDQRVGRLRERVLGAVRGQPPQADHFAVAVQAAVESLVLDRAESAAGQARSAWEASEAGASLLVGRDDLGRTAPDLRRRAASEAADWQQEVHGLVRATGSDRRNPRFLAYGAHALGVALVVLVLARRMPAAAGPGSPRESAVLARKLLQGVFGDTAVRSMVERAGTGLEGRLTALMETERSRPLAVVEALQVAADSAEQLRAAARRVDDRRFELTRAGAAPTS